MTEPKPRDESRPTTFNVLFVCTGNTCRSPMAEAVARRALIRRGWTHVAVRSAGTSAGADQPAAENAVSVAAEHDLDLSGHRSRPLDPADVAWADLILVMSTAHLWHVAEMGGADKVALITEFLDEGEEGVPDPFGGDEEVYRAAFERLDRAVESVLRRLEPILAP